ncbi:MAG: hypothetical protein Q8R02_08390 [Hyphomonadaceae bacterium]|nr:hypothetical protein [Hyphomonadaceae bacterium]
MAWTAYNPPEEFPDLPGWRFSCEETSAMVYRVAARNSDGLEVSAWGTEPNLEAVTGKCHQAALAIERAKQR